MWKQVLTVYFTTIWVHCQYVFFLILTCTFFFLGISQYGNFMDKQVSDLCIKQHALKFLNYVRHKLGVLLPFRKRHPPAIRLCLRYPVLLIHTLDINFYIFTSQISISTHLFLISTSTHLCPRYPFYWFMTQRHITSILFM